MTVPKRQTKLERGTKPGFFVGDFRWVRKVLMEWYRLTHPSENLDPFWVGPHLFKQIILVVSVKCEEKSGKIATPCCT